MLARLVMFGTKALFTALSPWVGNSGSRFGSRPLNSGFYRAPTKSPDPVLKTEGYEMDAFAWWFYDFIREIR